MSTVKALAEVLVETVGFVTDHIYGRLETDDPRDVAAYLKGRLQDIIAVESAGARLVTNEAGRAAERKREEPDYAALESRVVQQQYEELEKRCALQLETIRELRAENERLLHQLSAASDTFAERYVLVNASGGVVQGADAHKRYEEELDALFATHRREIAKLQLESDRRARSVAEAVIERVVQIGITERKAIEDINIDAIVTGTKHT